MLLAGLFDNKIQTQGGGKKVSFLPPPKLYPNKTSMKTRKGKK